LYSAKGNFLGCGKGKQALVLHSVTDSVREVSVPLAKEMEKQGFAIPVSKL
jgi:hypothetical protein